MIFIHATGNEIILPIGYMINKEQTTDRLWRNRSRIYIKNEMLFCATPNIITLNDNPGLWNQFISKWSYGDGFMLSTEQPVNCSSAMKMYNNRFPQKSKSVDLMTLWYSRWLTGFFDDLFECLFVRTWLHFEENLRLILLRRVIIK